MSMIRFAAITEDNFDAIIAKKRPEGENFVAPNSVSLAQAWLYREEGDVFPCAICDDDVPVGFMLFEEDMEERRLWIWRIMIAPEHEGKGYATAAVRLAVELARSAGKYEGIYLDCAPENVSARHIYDKLGFVPTGEINHGSTEMKIGF